MKTIKWKILIITSVVCVLPIALGIALWDKLPDMMAIHFNINNEPDNFASKGFVVFGLPVLMMLFQWIMCVSIDLSTKNHPQKVEAVIKWIIPTMTVVLYLVTLGYSLGEDIDIRQVAVTLVGLIFIVMGNYLPKLDYVKNMKLSKEKARKVNRFTGYGMVIFGALFIGSLFFKPFASVICLLLLIPFTVAILIYTIVVAKK